MDSVNGLVSRVYPVVSNMLYVPEQYEQELAGSTFTQEITKRTMTLVASVYATIMVAMFVHWIMSKKPSKNGCHAIPEMESYQDAVFEFNEQHPSDSVSIAPSKATSLTSNGSHRTTDLKKIAVFFGVSPAIKPKHKLIKAICIKCGILRKNPASCIIRQDECDDLCVVAMTKISKAHKLSWNRTSCYKAFHCRFIDSDVATRRLALSAICSTEPTDRCDPLEFVKSLQLE